MRLLKFNNEYVELVDINDNKYKGMALFTDADTAYADEDSLSIVLENREIYLFYESEIKSIKIIED